MILEIKKLENLVVLKEFERYSENSQKNWIGLKFSENLTFFGNSRTFGAGNFRQKSRPSDERRSHAPAECAGLG